MKSDKDLLRNDKIKDTGCLTKHDSLQIVLNVFFNNLLSCLRLQRIIKNIIWQSYYDKVDFLVKYI